MRALRLDSLRSLGSAPAAKMPTPTRGERCRSPRNPQQEARAWGAKENEGGRALYSTLPRPAGRAGCLGVFCVDDDGHAGISGDRRRRAGRAGWSRGARGVRSERARRGRSEADVARRGDAGGAGAARASHVCRSRCSSSERVGARGGEPDGACRRCRVAAPHVARRRWGRSRRPRSRCASSPTRARSRAKRARAIDEAARLAALGRPLDGVLGRRVDGRGDARRPTSTAAPSARGCTTPSRGTRRGTRSSTRAPHRHRA